MGKTIAANPLTMEKLIEAASKIPGAMGPATRPIEIFGMKYVSNPLIPRFKQAWKFPESDVFVYEDSDLDWCKFFGFGKYEDTHEPVVYLINDMSPSIRLHGIS